MRRNGLFKRTVAVAIMTTMVFQGMIGVSVPAMASTIDEMADEVMDTAIKSATSITGTQKMENTGAEIFLTEEGNVDWAYFDNTLLSAYEKKKVSTHYLTNFASIQNTSGTTDTKWMLFPFEDGTNKTNNTATYKTEKKGIICNGKDNGFTFDVKGNTSERTVRIYTGAYQSTVKIEAYVNDDTTPVETVNYTATASTGNIAEFKIVTAADTDVIHFKIYSQAVTDAQWGSVSLQAVTLYDVNPPEFPPVPPSEEFIGDETSAVMVKHPNGKISELNFKNSDNKTVNVPFKNDGWVGPSWQENGQNLILNKSETDDHTYTVNRNGIIYGIKYLTDVNGVLTLQATIENTTSNSYQPDRSSLVLGIDTYMKDTYDSYKNLFFPTMLRCEKTHLWGYFQSPENDVVAIAVDAPVSSYRLQYESGNHRINTAVLDMMQKDETLPERHPRNNNTIAANEKRTWNVKLKLAASMNDVQNTITQMLNSPVIEMDRYTIGANETSEIRIHTNAPIATVAVTKPDGKAEQITVTKESDNIYVGEYTPTETGVYTLKATADGYVAEAKLSCRMTWKWYMQQAKQAAVDHPAKGADCAESYYNLYTGFLGMKYFPNSEQDDAIDAKFEEMYYRVINYSEEGVPSGNPKRIQNHSTILGMLVDRYEAKRDIDDVIRATKIAKYLMSKQDSNGAYIGPTGDYTSVIYPAKSMMELLKVEKRLIQEGNKEYDWQGEYDKHYDSVKRAMDNLVLLDGDLHTEGQLTFEDGAVSCSATQLSEFALMHEEGSEERETYKESAMRYLTKHQALEQTIIPDSRVNGCSLRFWEAQYDVLLTANPNNMMNSPHGWTGWTIYALFNMYELTGDITYLQKAMNTMGSCAQLMSFDGNLNWAFIADPYIKGNLFVQKENDTSEFGEGERKSVTLGETYVDMISDWWRTPPDTYVGGYYGQGGACDNNVHEIFKVMEENVLTKAFVIESEDGSFETYNCTAMYDGGKLKVNTYEDEITSEISFNLRSNKEYEITYTHLNKTITGTAQAGISSSKINVEPETVSITPSSVTMKVEEEAKLSAIVAPENVLEKEVTWLVADTTIATINEKGLLVAKKAGETTVTATSANGITDTCKVTVKAQDPPPESGEQYLSDLDWMSATTGWSNAKKDTNVDGNGKITLRVDGTVETFEKGISAHASSTVIYNITARGAKRFQAYVGIDAIQGTKGSATFKVYVDNELKYTSEELTGASNAVKVDVDIAGGKKLKLVADQGANNANDHSVWADAKLIFDKEDITNKVTAISVDPTHMDIVEGEKKTIKVTITPETAINKNYTWSSTNENVAIVENGNVVAKKAGEATVTATSEDGGKTASCIVTVSAKPIEVDKKVLNAKITEASTKEENLYTKESWKVFQTALDEARKVAADTQATQVQVNLAVQTLSDAIGQLQLILKNGWYQEGSVMKYYEDNKIVSYKWVQESDGRYRYAGKDGIMVFGWQRVDAKWYYLDKEGYRVHGWREVDNQWYYLKDSGAMATGWLKVDHKWYYLKSNGAMATGWKEVDNKWYYLKDNGVMITGWIKVNHKWYYSNTKGDMAVGWKLIDHKWYYLKNNGVMATGWLKVDNKWYYLKSNGVMATGWIKVDHKWYYLKNNGVMAIDWMKVDNKWYYLKNNGVMASGWVKVDHNWYYLYSNGSMASNVWIKNCYVNSLGVWVKSR